MKTLFGLTLAMVITVPVSAQSFTHPCEVIYYEINKKNNTSGYTMSDFLNCKEEFGTTKLIKKAEKYKKSVADRVDEVERRIIEAQETARGERAGKIVQSYDLRGMSRHPKNILRVPFASHVWDAEKDKTYETPADKVCQKLGFESAVASSESALISAGDREALRDAPEKILEMRQPALFRKAKDIVYSFNAERPSRNKRIMFRYFTEITCERQVQEGEQIQDFELDIEAIRRQVERDTEAPELDDDVKAILSIGRQESIETNKGLGEDYDDGYNNDDGHWEPEIDRDDFFIVSPK
jgi:hypothetical protein